MLAKLIKGIYGLYSISGILKMKCIDQMKRERINYLDTLRVIACFLVVLCHVGDFYVGNGTDEFSIIWSKYITFTRPCVPLFILLSGTLLLPLKRETGAFLKHRFFRVVIPFLVWSVLYVFLPLPGKIVFGGPANVFTGNMNIYSYNLMMIPLNFTASNVHFWFMYTIIGLYLFMPIISPWIKGASKKDLIFFLCIWVVTLFYPYIRFWFPQIQGECDWNSYGMLFYFNGYLGYLIMGIFLHHYNKLSAKKSCLLGVLLFIAGYYITYKGLWIDIGRMNSQHVSEVNAEGWKIIETRIGYLTINVAMMTAGLFLFFQKLKLSKTVTGVIAEISKLSYGLFLIHYILHLWITSKLSVVFTINPKIDELLLAVIIFIASYVVAKALSYLPKAKYIVGYSSR